METGNTKCFFFFSFLVEIITQKIYRKLVVWKQDVKTEYGWNWIRVMSNNRL
jgi:hypothetical protein